MNGSQSVLFETPLCLWVRAEQRRKANRDQRQRPNAYRLCKLSMRDDLTTWEQSFVATLLKARRLSKKQQRLFDELWAKHHKA